MLGEICSGSKLFGEGSQQFYCFKFLDEILGPLNTSSFINPTFAKLLGEMLGEILVRLNGPYVLNLMAWEYQGSFAGVSQHLKCQGTAQYVA